MSREREVEIRDVSQNERGSLDAVLEQSFTGIYLRHARRTITEVETVRGAFFEGRPVGLSMLKIVEGVAGYVYYIAVIPSSRRKSLGSKLLHDAVELLTSQGGKEIYASVGEDNVESNALFRSNGFRRTGFGEVSRKYGMLKAMSMYRAMFVVPGEVLLVLDGPSLTSFTTSRDAVKG